MADIVFITPTLEESISQESVGTLLLASILHNSGLDISIVPFFRFGDPNDFDVFLSNAVDTINHQNPRIVSFYTRCDSYHIMLKLAERIKPNCNAYIVFAGPQADITAVDTLQQIPYVDFICCGEGETTIEPFYQSLLQNEPDLSVAGLVYRKDGRIISNPRPKLIQDLDSLPRINYSLSPLSPRNFLADYFPIDVGRGCPFGCTYCSTKTFWGRKYRLKSPQRILDEIKDLNHKFGVTSFAFEHDMFTLNRTQVFETCRLLSTLDFPIRWKCSARIDCLDEALIDTMVSAGMDRIFIGIETGSPRMQKVINKNLKLDDIAEKISYISSKGVRINTSFIYGFPDETDADISKTLALIGNLLKLNNVVCSAHLCTFLPGTELSNAYINSLTTTNNFSNITGSLALDKCWDLISQHPVLFPHFQEFVTPLRSKLIYVEVFIYTWFALQPIFQYISEKYPSEQLIHMYYDFVNANNSILAKIENEAPSTQIKEVICNDAFLNKFQDDPYYDIMSDALRMFTLKETLRKKGSGSITGAFSFSPTALNSKVPLQSIPRTLTVVTYTFSSDGKIQTQIRTRKQ